MNAQINQSITVFVDSYTVKCFCERQDDDSVETLGLEKFKDYVAHQLTATLGIAFYLIPPYDRDITINNIKTSVDQWNFNKLQIPQKPIPIPRNRRNE